MKTVFNNQQVAHVWAQNNQSNGRGSNLFFEHGTIYSYGYHFPIARHFTHKGKPCVMLTDRSYSVSTRRHTMYVRRAIPQALPIFTVARVESDPTGWLIDHKNAIKAAIVEFEQAKGKVQIRKAYREFTSVRHTAVEFCTFFGCSNAFTNLPERLLEKEQIAITYVKNEAAEREARQRAKDAKRQARLAMELPEVIEDWRKNGTNDYRLYDVPTMLRISSSTNEVISSRGARIPLEHALRVLPIVEAILLEGREYHANGHTIRLGHFQIDSIDVNGTLRAGCHTIEKGELLRLAESLKALQVQNV